ncbi:outer membrane lipoprotein-sorting protein [Cerasicoccus maritimus]|uniref:outer membrane lipoprotein-sorting protein n=1 Tax=Cerasicoccus maritimus TaxID=490089 RepID=UPI0028528B12|nr:outer membrane lipoprotein-sorting protein [Cerasicoccus maritimus]
MMRRCPFLISCILACIFITVSQTGFKKVTYKSGPQIMDEVVNRHKADSELELIKLAIIDDEGNTQVREMISVFSKTPDGEARYLIRFLSPSDVKGITLLTNEANSENPEQWFYMPALGQARKIAGDNRSGYFMGSDFTFEDLRKENTQEHSYHRLQDDAVNGMPVYVVMAAPADIDIQTATGYANRLLYIDKANFNVLKVEFYEENNDQPVKVLEADKYSEVEIDVDADRPARLRMNNYANGTVSVMTLLKSRLNVPVDDKLFDPESLNAWTPEMDKPLLDQFNADS